MVVTAALYRLISKYCLCDQSTETQFDNRILYNNSLTVHDFVSYGYRHATITSEVKWLLNRQVIERRRVQSPDTSSRACL